MNFFSAVKKKLLNGHAHMPDDLQELEDTQKRVRRELHEEIEAAKRDMERTHGMDFDRLVEAADAVRGATHD